MFDHPFFDHPWLTGLPIHPDHLVGNQAILDPLVEAIVIAAFSPLVVAFVLALLSLVRGVALAERSLFTLAAVGFISSFAGSAVVLGLELTEHPTGEMLVGSWLRIGRYEVPFVFLIDEVSALFSFLAAGLSALVAYFSRTYLHRESGFSRFFVLLLLFSSGCQIVAFAGAFDLFFAGWELLGFSSALFIGFFFERREPVASSVRAFATYRICDVAFFLAIVATHELLGSTRLSVLDQAETLGFAERNVIAALYLVAALGKSAQLPFSTWMPRAMEGPTPSSALFYGAVSIHMGLYLMLRVWPLLDVAPAVEVVGLILGFATAVYAVFVGRVQTDVKCSLAYATLAQTGLILAEIAAGFPTFALIHMIGHALLRVWQFLRAPNELHEVHERGHINQLPSIERLVPERLHLRVYAAALHRFRLDDHIDVLANHVLRISKWLLQLDARFQRALSRRSSKEQA